MRELKKLILLLFLSIKTNFLIFFWQFGESVLRDLKKSWEWIVLLIIIATVISLVYIAIMRWITWIMVWLSLLGCVALLSFSTYYTWTKYEELRDFTSNEKVVQKKQDLADAIEDEWDKLISNKDTWLAFFIISIILLFIILLILLILRKRIRIAVALINEGSKYVK